MLIATEYLIIRGVVRGKPVPLDREPTRVVTLLNEQKFLELKGELIHHDTVFFEDKFHDWFYRNGFLKYSGCVNSEISIVAIYSEKYLSGPFCPNCGKRIHPENECTCN
jgi:hypothetical protein